ncbi:MAG TPA: outer membrane beta-barrel protein [Bacteroidales bacterium]|nr:outer membrane beta-barrel protein [Bacteroidales bacterium]
MKKIGKYGIPLIILLFLFSGELNAQRIKGAVIAGGSLTQVEGDEIKGWSQFGFTGGVGAIIPFARHWGVNLETLFTQKGSFQKSQFPGDSLTNEYRLRLNYFEVPLYISYTDKDVMTFGLGGYFGRLTNAREEEHSGKQTPYIDTVAFNNNDFGFLVDFKVRIWGHLHINVRYTQSLVSIRERVFYPRYIGGTSFSRDQYNQVISLRFVYIFNESRSRGEPVPD